MTTVTMDVRPYHESALFYDRNPYGGGSLMKAQGALCADKVRRNAFPSAVGEMRGQPDTYFSIPCFVYAGRRRVYGYITTDYMNQDQGLLATVYFHAYKYRKNWMLVEPVHGPPAPYVPVEEDI